MKRPLKITARDFVLTEPVEQQIREKVDWLETFYDRITGCEVVVSRENTAPVGLPGLSSTTIFVRGGVPARC